MFLSRDIFSCVVENTPLIAIDLIIKNQHNQILLGKRVNEPAYGFWFVPGGRIYKDESLDTAFARTVNDELNIEFDRKNAKLQGVYEHFYDNNVFNNDFSTHYVVLAHIIELNNTPLLNNQHSDYQWFEIENLLVREDIHKYTKDYFR